MALNFDFVNSIIEVPSPTTSVSVQTLINEIRDAEDELNPAMTYPKIADAFGKQDLGGGSLVGITLVLLDNWKVRFQARAGPETVACIITGGNLVAQSGNPVAASAYTSVTIAQSSSPTIASSGNTDLKYLIESLRGLHPAMGNSLYWDPVNGNDSKDGTTPTNAVLTFAQAQSLVTAGRTDVIYCLANDPSGITTVTETVNITKNGLKLRGPGYTFQIKPVTTTNDSLVIAADSVEVSGLYLETAATGTRNAVSITGNNNLIKDCWINNVRSHGITISSSSFTKITSCVIEHCAKSGTGNGVNVGNSTIQLAISKNIIFDNINGVSLSGTGVADNLVENNLIYQNSARGVDVGVGVLRTHVRGANTFSKNTLGNTRDLGTDTFIESQAGGASASEIADAVWDEVIAGHNQAGSTARTLKEARTRATLASLR